MSVIRLASRYAKSLLDLAIEQNKLERVTSDMESFESIVKNRDFYLLLKSPIVPTDKKRNILKAIFEGKFDEMTMAFMNILLLKHREPYLPDIAKEFMLQYKHIKHVSTVHVLTAEPIGEATLSAIKAQLLKNGTTDDHIEFLVEVDPEIKGGLILEYDGNRYDASVRSKLDDLKKEFSENLYVSKIVAN
ncbi:MAG: ATP synthase F1 subunit delta [Saprospiraceae bacterium]|nr:ATP synthase F1 subunit delta [Saprospiraceae bacterium]